MRTMRAKVFGAMVLVVVATGAPAGEEPLRALLARARLLEENSRTLEQAVSLYERIATEARGDRTTAATAHLRAALVKERQGKPEARGALEHVIRHYPDQAQVVGIARDRVARHVIASRGRQEGLRVLPPAPEFPSAVSRDGRLGVVIAREHPLMTLQDLESGETTLLVAGTATAWARTPALSPDGRMVAFSWVEIDRPISSGPPYPEGTTSLKVIEAAAGRTPRTVVPSAPGPFAISPVAWASEGRRLLVHLQNRARWADPPVGAALAWVDVETGSTRVIKSLEPWSDVGGGGQGQGFHGVSLSPDERWITYSARAREASTDRDIYIVAADGTGEPTVISPAGTSTEPVWTADGAHLVFAHERSGERGLWFVPVVAGRPTAEPRSLQQEFSGWGVDVTHGNELVSVDASLVGFWSLIAKRDPGGARVVGAVEGQGAMFSRGGRLAFVRHRRGGHDLVVRTMSTGEERLYTHAGLSNYASPRWFGDDTAVVVFVDTTGDGGTPGGAFYKVDLASGVFTRLFARHSVTHHRSTSSALSRDGKALYLAVRADERAPWTGIVAVDLATGRQGEVIPLTTPLSARGMPGMALSPNGRTLALHTWADETSTNGRILTLDLEAGGTQIIQSAFPGGGWSDRLRWTPDGMSLLYVQQVTEGPEGSWRVMQVPAAGGTSTFDGLDSAQLVTTVSYPALETGNVASIDLSPDGEHIVFSSRPLPRYTVRLRDLSSLIAAQSMP